jgi:PAS domain S-box-containing protein
MSCNENSEMLLTILDGVLTPIVYVNSDLQYVFVNKAYMDWYELEREEIEGKYIRDILASDVYEPALPNYQSVLKGQSIYFENKTVRKCEEKYVSVRMLPHAVNDEVIGFFSTITDITELKLAEIKNKKLIEKLSESLAEVKMLSGLLPICSSCKKIRDDKGYWNNLELYIETHSEAQFSHGLCPECLDKLYGDQDWYIKRGKKI